MRSLSLRTRLVAVVLLLLALATVVIAVVTALTLRGFLLGRLDGDLRVTSRIDPDLPPLPPLGRGPRPPDMLTAELRDGDVTAQPVIGRDGQERELPSTEYPELEALPVDGRPHTVNLGELGDYRVVATRTPVGSVLVTGLSERPMNDTVTRLVSTEVGVGAVTLLGAGVAGAFLVRRELRPLERVATTAARVSALPLARGEVALPERVPDADPRTEVGQVGAALNRMLDHVAAALETRHASETQLRQFVADASHELRTPLSAITGYTELVGRAELPADAAYSVARISSQAERMTTLVEDLLLLARLDAGRPLERAPVDLTRLVLDAVDDARVAGPDHRWELALPAEPVVVIGDALRLTQVITNLLANARTHTPAGTTVTVTLDPSPLRLSVVDNGPGIPAEQLPHVFERFARGSASRSRDAGGTGLGLAIVDAVVAAHGGNVEVLSGPGRTAFTVHLPARARDSQLAHR